MSPAILEPAAASTAVACGGAKAANGRSPLVPRVRLLGRSVSSCHLTALAGYATAIALAFSLTMRLELLPPMTVILAAAGSLSILALAMATKVLSGEERLTYYHHEIAVLAATALVARALEGRATIYLDVMALSIGGFFIFGRLGCFLVGCCQGRPAGWGVRYGEEHAAEGFPRYLIGVRLIPIQLIESAWVLGTVVGGVALVVGGAPPGSALAWYTVVYGLGRFAFEFLRGDSARPYFGTFSEAQWTSLLLMSLVSIGELTAAVPLRAWHVLATAGLAAAMGVIAIRERQDHRLFRPRHLREVAELIEAARRRAVETGEIYIGQTSLGVSISASALNEGPRPLDLVALSCRDRELPPTTVARLARVVARLRRCEGHGDLLRGESGVYHLLLPRPAHAL